MSVVVVYAAERRRSWPMAACLAKGLSLAATPTFALMAAITGPAPLAELCSAGGSLDGMVLMYLLMSAFHAPAWLRLAVRRP